MEGSFYAFIVELYDEETTNEYTQRGFVHAKNYSEAMQLIEKDFGDVITEVKGIMELDADTTLTVEDISDAVKEYFEKRGQS